MLLDIFMLKVLQIANSIAISLLFVYSDMQCKDHSLGATIQLCIQNMIWALNIA